jgi:hypothetical protein
MTEPLISARMLQKTLLAFTNNSIGTSDAQKVNNARLAFHPLKPDIFQQAVDKPKPLFYK